MIAVRGTSSARSDARQLRRVMSLPELTLWSALRARQLGLHFRRQHAAGPFVMDFYCSAARLCIEVDGQQHEQSAERDGRRDSYQLRTFDIRTIRIAAADVLGNLEGVIEHIRGQFQAPSGMLRTPSPPPGGE